jgi:nicotinamide-nucleotide amidase
MVLDSLLTETEVFLGAGRAKGIMLATVESCTGGLIAAVLTAIAGSSDVVDRGFITYSNEAKNALIEVAMLFIQTHGAVGENVACALARSRAAIAITVIGVAGPGGGTANIRSAWYASASRENCSQ